MSVTQKKILHYYIWAILFRIVMLKWKKYHDAGKKRVLCIAVNRGCCAISQTKQYEFNLYSFP